MATSPAEPELITAEVIEPQPTVRPHVAEAPPRELIAICLMVALADVTLYWGRGYAGLGVFLLAAPVVYLLGRRRPRLGKAFALAAAVVVMFALRIFWFGSPLRVTCGVAALVALAAAMQTGRIDLRALLLPFQAPVGGVAAIVGYCHRILGRSGRFPVGLVLSIGLPVIALAAFGTLFVLANPDVVTFVTERLGEFAATLERWLTLVAPEEIFLWAVVALLTAGFLRPLVDLGALRFAPRGTATSSAQADARKMEPAALYPTCRNALWAVIGLFAVYLVFEFKTLWFRDFPPDFYYAGYAHQGAFWLTVALALATAILSLIFRGPMLADARLPALKRLAWVWCVLNGLLAIAVFNRMFVYIGFNGLTHMRIVGLFGISAVVAGFALVVWKIARRKDFLWLVSRQMRSLAIVIMLYAMTPVDAISAGYNVRRILAGDSSAVMQIGVQPVDVEGILTLPPLLDCDDPEIRTGIRALLAEHYRQLEARHGERTELGWTARQFVDGYALQRLRPYADQWSDYKDDAARRDALEKFREYAYQWY